MGLQRPGGEATVSENRRKILFPIKSIEDSGDNEPIEKDTALAEGERAGGVDPNLFRIFGLMWGAIRTIGPWLNHIPADRAAPSRAGGGSPDMRISRVAFCLLGLTSCTFVGCSAQAWGVRSSSPTKTRTVASVGDKPLPIVD